MKVGVIGAGTMGQGIAKAFAQVEGYTVALCDIKQEWAEGGKNKIAAGYAKLVAKGKLDQAEVDRRMAAITAGLKEDLRAAASPPRGEAFGVTKSQFPPCCPPGSWSHGSGGSGGLAGLRRGR